MINDISHHHSPKKEEHIKKMDKNISDMQKENRVRYARLIQKQSELSSRQHSLSEKKLIHTKLKEENKKKKEIMKKCQEQIDNYRSQIDSIKKEILQAKANLKAITAKTLQTNKPNLDTIRASISKRKKKVNEIQDKMANLQNEDKNLDFQKQKLVQLVDSKQQILLKFASREEKVSQTLQTPIDDLRLEELTVNKLEQFVFQANNDFDKSESFSDNFNDELYVKQIEEENENKKNRINQLKERIKFLQSQPPIPKSRKFSSTPTKRINKIESIKYDKNRLLRFNSTINSFKERQKMIDQLENTTTNVQIAWANDQKQIEDSWMGKIDDMQVLQKKVDEVNNLIFDIDELSGKIHQLKEEESLLSERKSECEKSKSKIELKLNEIGECHNTIQKQVDDYIKKKEKVDQTTENIKRKKKNISILKNQIKQLDNLYKQYRIKVKAIESKANEIKSLFNAKGYQDQINEPFDHVKFNDHLIPESNEMNKLNADKTTNVNVSPQPKKKEEKLTTPKSKNRKDLLNNDKLSDSTFSMGELEKDESASSIIDGRDQYYDTNILDPKNNSNYNSNKKNNKNEVSNNFHSSQEKKNNLSKNESFKNSSQRSSINNKSSQRNSISDKSSQRSPISNKNSQRSLISDKSSQRSPISNKSYQRNSISDKSYQRSPISDKSYQRSPISDKSSQRSPISNKSYQRSPISDKSSQRSLISNKSYQRSPISNKSNKSYERKSEIDINNSLTDIKNNNTMGSIHSSSLSNNDINQDSQRSEIEIEFSDNENTKSVGQSPIKNQSVTKSEMKFSNASKDSKLDSIKKIIKEEQEEEEILSKYTNGNTKKDNQYSSDFIPFNPKDYEEILNCTESSRSTFLNNDSMKPNDTTFKTFELEDEIVEEEEEIPENGDEIKNELIEEEEEEIIDVFDNVSASYQVDSNPVFPTPELFSDKNSNVYEYSKEMSDVEAASASASASTVAASDDDKDFQTTELKNLFSESTKSQITPTKRAHPSNIDIDISDMETPNIDRYKRNRQIAKLDDESDEEFNDLVKEAQNAIQLPLLRSKYQSP